MRNRFRMTALTLAAFLPMLAQPLAAQREGSWEFSLGGGAMVMDRALGGYLNDRGFPDSTKIVARVMPAIAFRLGYNVSPTFGFSVGTSGSMGTGVTYMTPFAAITYTGNLNAKTSPFLTLGTNFTRISGNDRLTHPTWGGHVGLGLRHMISAGAALRLEGRMRISHFSDLPGEKTAYNSIATLGFSFFTAGRRPRVVMAAPLPAVVVRDTMWSVRVDTVWQVAVRPAPPPIVYVDTVVIVLRDTLILQGVNFTFNGHDLTRESYVILNRVVRAMQLAEWENTRWEIAGHTSSIGETDYNMALSKRRAESVRAYLVSQGISNSRLVPHGYGESFPAFPNNADGRQPKNRRVELRRIRT